MRATVAAVCHRGRGPALEFLLVRTKGGKLWTLPKGHVERGEEPWAAAGREAREEAGVQGKVDAAPLTTYRAASRDADEPIEVTAFLLAVESQVEPEESFRNPTWFDAAAAKQHLASGGREPDLAAELARVIDVATFAVEAAIDAG